MDNTKLQNLLAKHYILTGYEHEVIGCDCEQWEPPKDCADPWKEWAGHVAQVIESFAKDLEIDNLPPMMMTECCYDTHGNPMITCSQCGGSGWVWTLITPIDADEPRDSNGRILWDPWELKHFYDPVNAITKSLEVDVDLDGTVTMEEST